MFQPGWEWIILMGEYAVVPKDRGIRQLATINVQTCLVLIMDSPAAVAMAHIDNKFHAAAMVDVLYDRLRQLNGPDANIKATLIGGHFRPLDPFGSARIYQPIITRLKQRAIPYEYRHYGTNFSVVFALAGWIFSTALARSWGCSISASLGFGVLGALVGLLLGGVSEFNSNYHPIVHLGSGLIEPNHASVFASQRMFRGLVPNRQAVLLARNRLLPDDVNAIESLRLNEYSPSM